MQQRVLPLVDEDGRRRVQRLQMHQPVLDSALAHDLVDAVGDVEQLHPVVRNPVEDAAKDSVAALRMEMAFVGAGGRGPNHFQV